MPNENCLEGIQCPKCKQEERFLIQADCLCMVEDDGADMASPAWGNGYEWSDRSYCRCPECQHEGVVSDFKIE